MDGHTEIPGPLTGAGGPPAFARILVGTDGSARAEEAVRQGARLASALGAAFEVTYVLDARHAGVEGEPEAKKVLGQAAGLAGAERVEAETRVLAGEPAEALVEEATDHKFDLVCVGADAGLLGTPIHVGRVAAHVLRESHCSVLVAREARTGGEAFPSRVLCGVDGSEGATGAALVAAEVAAATGAELRLMHVVPVFHGGNVEWPVAVDREGFEGLGPAAAEAAERGVVPVREMAMGRPAAALVEAANRNGVDLMVVGCRGLRGVSRVLLGSVSEWVAEHAPCSVLVVRPSYR